jgi:PAS domain S-box-containing protein
MMEGATGKQLSLPDVVDGAAFREAPMPMHVWRGTEDPLLESLNERARDELRGRNSVWMGKRAAELLAHDIESFTSLKACLRQRRTIEIQPVPYLHGDGSRLFAVRHVFVPPDAAITFARELSLNDHVVALRAVDQKYRTLIESVDAVVWQADPITFEMSYISSTIERFGYTVEEAMRPGFWISWLHSDDREWAMNFCRQMIVSQKDHSYEYRVVAPDGTVRWVRDVIAVRQSPEGKTELYGVFLDITEHRVEQRERQFDLLLLETSFESSSDGMVVVTPDGDVAFHNSALLEMFGLREDPGRLIGHPLLEIDAAAINDCELALPSGRIAIRTLTPLSGRDGQSFGHLVSFHDITERRHSEDQLREREAQFRSLIEHSSDVICVMDRDGIIEYKSPAIFDTLGFTPEEMVGTSVYDEVCEEDVPLTREAVERLLRTGTPQQVLLRARHKNGALKWFLVVFSQLRTKDGERIVANARDITERKMLESTLEKTQRMTSLGHLAATIAHEMNNVLMAIQPNVEYLGRVLPDDARMQRIVRTIGQSVRRGSRITQEILSFTRPAEPRLQPVDVRRWLTDLITEAQPMLGSRIELGLHLPGEAVLILGDTAALNQAFTNLLLNARDALQGSGRIDITVADAHSAVQSESTKPLDSLVRISVCDNGPGMTREVSERIFEPLFTTKQRGMGLGLGVVHQIISAHGGFIHVDTAEGKGATFHVYVPRSEEPEPASLHSAIAIPEGMRVLLVEDEIAISTGLTYTLQIEGAEVRAVDRGGAVIDTIESFRPAVVVLDVGLPDMSGTDVLARIREKWPALPVIFSTGHADAGRLNSLLEPPLVDVVLKPYETSELLIKLHDAIHAP